MKNKNVLTRIWKYVKNLTDGEIRIPHSWLPNRGDIYFTGLFYIPHTNLI